jgi:Na+/H+ antiporter NhaD/arsenite permease-like protein
MPRRASMQVSGTLSISLAAMPSAGPLPPTWMAGFFIALLLAIAIVPLVQMISHWWEKNLNKLLVGLALAATPVIWLVINGHVALLQATLLDYVSFIVLLGSLFYVTGGIYVAGDMHATPATNTLYLGVATALASIVGTTGASMLFIRPVLRTNRERKYRVHTVVFFIFLVSNIGGSLLPLGDPPLFLGHLEGVPFWWTLRLWPQMLFMSTLLLVLFYFVDSYLHTKEPPIVEQSLHLARVETLRLEGKINLLWLGGIVAAVALIHTEHGLFLREAVMITCAVGSRYTSPIGPREHNKFSWGPILEISALFIGIFMTMIPALLMLEAHGATLGVNTPARFFWASGSLSSFLDNSPTYLVFFNTAKGMTEQGLLAGPLVDGVGVPTVVLTAIACGSVFMGANSYIGNGPNFMVKAIAEDAGVQMPSFFGYMKWSCAILIPSFILLTLVFFL